MLLYFTYVTKYIVNIEIIMLTIIKKYSIIENISLSLTIKYPINTDMHNKNNKTKLMSFM